MRIYEVSMDGVADFASIQRAIDAVSSRGGGHIYVRPGIYCEKMPITVPPNIARTGSITLEDCKIIHEQGD